MSDCLLPGACSDGAPTPSRYTEFRLLMRSIVQDNFSTDELRTFHWRMELPKRVLEESTPSIAILRALEERNIALKWCTDQTQLIQILEETLHRNDLAERVQQWSGKGTMHLLKQLLILTTLLHVNFFSLDQRCSGSKKPEVCLVQQEADAHNELRCDQICLSSTDNEDSRETVYNPPGTTNWMVRRRRSSRKSCLEPVDEEVDGLQIKSKPIDKDAVIHVTSSSKEDSTEHCISTMPEGHDSLCRTTSVASSGYFSERGSMSYRISDVSLLSSCAEPWQEEIQSYPETEYSHFEEKDSVVRMSPGGKSIHPKQAHKVLVPEELRNMPLVPRPASPVPLKKHEVCLERLEADDGFQEPTDSFRPRAKSLPSNARAISKQVQSRIRNLSSTSSSSSLRSESPDTTSGSCYSSHQSLSSDHSSSESSNGEYIYRCKVTVEVHHPIISQLSPGMLLVGLCL